MAASNNNSSNTIRNNVLNLITTTRTKDFSTVADIKNLSRPQQFSRLISAATALHRATRPNSSYQITDTQKKDCAAAAMIIAEKRGIKPANDGKYTKDQIETFLNPKEMLTNLASFYIYEEGKTKEQDTRKNIQNIVENAYDNDAGAAQPAVEIVQTAPAMPPQLSKDAVLSMSDEEYKEYALNMDPAVKAEIDEERKKQGDDLGAEPNENDAVQYQGLRDDPDWGHKKDDDDFKIEQGDIIEYLMKDVILSSVAWAGNKVAGFTGVVSYELLSAGAKEIQPYGREAKDKIAYGWSKIKKSLFGDEDATEENQNQEPSGGEQTFNTISGLYEGTLKDKNDIINKQREIIEGKDPRIEKTLLLHRRIVKHLAVLGEDGIIFDDGTTKPYAEYCGDGIDSQKLKEGLKELQKNSDTYNIDFMIKELGYENNPEKQKEVKDWYQKYTKNKEDSIKNSNSNVPISEPKEFINSYNKAQKSLQERLAFQPQAETIKAQTSLFAAHYAMHLYLEELRKNPEGEVATNPEKAKQFYAQQELNSAVTFLTVAKAVSEGKTELNGQPLLSRENMIAEAEKLVNASKDAIEQKKTEPVEDTKIKPFTNSKKTTQGEAESMINAALRPDPSEQYAAYMHNLDLAEKEQILKQNEINARRDRAKKALNEHNQTTNTDAGKKYTQQKGPTR